MEAHRQKKITTEAHRYRDTEERKRINHGGTETRSEITTEARREIVKCCGSPRELGGGLLHLSSTGLLRSLLHAIDETNAGAHERQQVRSIHLSPAFFRHREQLERHHQRLRA